MRISNIPTVRQPWYDRNPSIDGNTVASTLADNTSFLVSNIAASASKHLWARLAQLSFYFSSNATNIRWRVLISMYDPIDTDQNVFYFEETIPALTANHRYSLPMFPSSIFVKSGNELDISIYQTNSGALTMSYVYKDFFQTFDI